MRPAGGHSGRPTAEIVIATEWTPPAALGQLEFGLGGFEQTLHGALPLGVGGGEAELGDFWGIALARANFRRSYEDHGFEAGAGG